MLKQLAEKHGEQGIGSFELKHAGLWAEAHRRQLECQRAKSKAGMVTQHVSAPSALKSQSSTYCSCLKYMLMFEVLLRAGTVPIARNDVLTGSAIPEKRRATERVSNVREPRSIFLPAAQCGSWSNVKLSQFRHFVSSLCQPSILEAPDHKSARLDTLGAGM